MAGQVLTLRAMRESAAARPRLGLRIVVLLVLLQVLGLFGFSLMLAGAARSAPLKSDISVTTQGGYARMVFSFPEDNDADVRLANGIVVIRFKKPVDVPVDRIAGHAGAYVSVARRDPDGTAVRLALIRKVTVNTMAAGEKLFVDLLPDNWVGGPPGLPQEVVDDLARRAREAEKKARQAQLFARQRQLPPVRVRIGTHPTFTRYVFELPEPIPVAVDHDKEKLTLVFDAPFRFDLVAVRAALPETIRAIETEPGEGAAEVRFLFRRKVDVRTFREDANFIMDVGAADIAMPAPGHLSLKPRALPGLVPAPEAKPAPAVASERPAPVPDKPAHTEVPAAPPQAAAPAAAAPPPPAPEIAAVQPAPPRASPAEPKLAAEPRPEPEKKAAASAVAPPPKPAQPAGPVVSEPAAAAEKFPPMQTVSEVPPALPPRSEPAPAVTPSDAPAPVAAALQRKGESLQLTFPFTAPTPAAVFRRFDTLWLVFDTTAPIDVTRLTTDPGRLIQGADTTSTRNGQVVRLKLDRPRLASAGTDGPAWSITLGDMVLGRTAPVAITRANVGPNRAAGVIPFDRASELHRLTDPEVGDTLLVVTALGPARGVLRTQDFVEFKALASTHGIAIQPLADDVAAEISPDKIVVGRPSGLTLSAVSYDLASDLPLAGKSGLFDPQRWGADLRAEFRPRQAQLMQAAAGAPEGRRNAARLDLARFYLGRELLPEAKGVLETALAEERPTVENHAGLLLRAITKVMMGRAADALTDLTDPLLTGSKDAALWRALALTQQGKWVEARESFKTAETVVTALPIELQRIALREQLRAAIEVRDFDEAARTLNELGTIGIPDELQPSVSVLAGRLAEGLGRISDAYTSYRSTAESPDRPAAAQARLRDILLRFSLKNITREQAIADLETLTTVWRGDETEIRALHLLGSLYLEDKRYRDAFYVMRNAVTAFPLSPMTREIQSQASAAFDSLFLGGKADSLPAIEALSLFYDFRDLMPVGRRGDEIIRRLADRLVAVDLLGQAAELLQHQVDNRLQGAARAQVATRLAVVYLMDRKPDKAIQVLHASRAADLNVALRNQRLLVEARALSDTGRKDLALEVIANLEGREVDRLRADVFWSGKRWREASEQIEKLYGERWRDFTPLAETERSDVLRAAIGYALAEDTLGADRFREKYGAKMAEGPQARAFEVVTTPFAASGEEFRAIAKAAASGDTLEQFLRDMRAHYPETVAPVPPPAAPAPAGEPLSRRSEPQRSTAKPAAANARTAAR
jgi:hypothetical protein